MRRILLAALATTIAVPAFAQDRTIVVEPVADTIATINAPIEYNEQGVMKAQYFRAEDLTPEQLAALYAEADRVRGYQRANGVYVNPETAAPAESYSIEAAAPLATATTYGSTAYSAPAATYTSETVTTYAEPVEIELYAPMEETTTMQTTSTHTVAKGDTLYNISKRFGVSVTELQQANGISGSAISLGQTLTIPGATMAMNTAIPALTYASTGTTDGYVTRTVVEPVQPIAATASTGTTYAVLPKDTLYAISRRTCVKVPELIAANGITDANALKPGQRLTIPAGSCLN